MFEIGISLQNADTIEENRPFLFRRPGSVHWKFGLKPSGTKENGLREPWINPTNLSYLVYSL